MVEIVEVGGAMEAEDVAEANPTPIRPTTTTIRVRRVPLNSWGT